jgi:hypothetical protein
MKILEWYDSAAIYCLCTLSQLGAGFGGFPLSATLVKEDFEKWELWLARGVLGFLFTLVSLLFLHLIIQAL